MFTCFHLSSYEFLKGRNRILFISFFFFNFVYFCVLIVEQSTWYMRVLNKCLLFSLMI